MKPNKDAKFSVKERVSSAGLGGSSDVGTIIGIKWVFYHRLEEWTWGYKIDWDNGGPGWAMEFIPEGYLKIVHE
jgi:hypothetical protein